VTPLSQQWHRLKLGLGLYLVLNQSGMFLQNLFSPLMAVVVVQTRQNVDQEINVNDETKFSAFADN
jgi:hypothetical protein